MCGCGSQSVMAFLPAHGVAVDVRNKEEVPIGSPIFKRVVVVVDWQVAIDTCNSNTHRKTILLQYGDDLQISSACSCRSHKNM